MMSGLVPTYSAGVLGCALMVRGLLGLGSPRLAPHDYGRTPISFNFISDTREIPARSLSQIGSRAPPKSPHYYKITPEICKSDF